MIRERSYLRRRILNVSLISLLSASLCGIALGQDAESLRERVARLEAELAEAQAELADAEAALAESESGLGSGINIETKSGGKLRVGGAVRVNYVIGDYPENADGAPSRGGSGGDFELDTFRFNADYSSGPWRAKGEYRFYNGYNFIHTGWVGYEFDENRLLQVGVNRVPFGAGPYGVSQSWFFDQHYYVGLADDMDLGAKYTVKSGDWSWDFAYYLRDEFSWRGATKQSARYSYDVVDETGDGFEERNQVNLRGLKNWESDTLSGTYGFSLQAGELRGNGGTEDGSHFAAALHAVTDMGNWKLGTQLSYYELDDVGVTTTFGAYDFPNQVAAKAWVPAVSLSYLVDTQSIDWLDSVRPYFEYSSIVKPEDGLNDSELVTFGTAFARGAWYVYLDWIWSNGNEFVGGEVPYGDRLGRNPYDDWQQRLNLNFGLYF